VDSDIEQAYDDRDLDIVIPFVPYDSIEEAEAAAKAANAHEHRGGQYVGIEIDSERKFRVISQSHVKHALQEANITLFTPLNSKRAADGKSGGTDAEIQTTIPAEDKKRLQAIAKSRGVPVATIIEEAIDQFAEREEDRRARQKGAPAKA
jgi:hypothetical protein